MKKIKENKLNFAV